MAPLWRLFGSKHSKADHNLDAMTASAYSPAQKAGPEVRPPRTEFSSIEVWALGLPCQRIPLSVPNSYTVEDSPNQEVLREKYSRLPEYLKSELLRLLYSREFMPISPGKGRRNGRWVLVDLQYLKGKATLRSPPLPKGVSDIHAMLGWEMRSGRRRSIDSDDSYFSNSDSDIAHRISIRQAPPQAWQPIPEPPSFPKSQFNARDRSYHTSRQNDYEKAREYQVATQRVEPERQDPVRDMVRFAPAPSTHFSSPLIDRRAAIELGYPFEVTVIKPRL
jgi:hypothetical protein